MDFSDQFYLKEGYICYREGVEKVYSRLDSTFLSFLYGKDYKAFLIPAMIEGRVLKKCGYFESFPDQIMSVGYFDDLKIPQIMSGERIDESFIKLSNRYLTPSACLHIYPMFENQTITENQIITTKARVYRCEKKGFENLTRLWDFSVREIVFIGSEEFVKEQLNEMKEKSLNFAKKISDKSEIVVAHDHFYKGERNDIKRKIQTKNELKYELRVPVGDKDVAVSSFNFHGYHFSLPFNFDNNRKIVSGCVGFGMERWVAACIENSFLDL